MALLLFLFIKTFIYVVYLFSLLYPSPCFPRFLFCLFAYLCPMLACCPWSHGLRPEKLYASMVVPPAHVCRLMIRTSSGPAHVCRLMIRTSSGADCGGGRSLIGIVTLHFNYEICDLPFLPPRKKKKKTFFLALHCPGKC